MPVENLARENDVLVRICCGLLEDDRVGRYAGRDRQVPHHFWFMEYEAKSRRHDNMGRVACAVKIYGLFDAFLVPAPRLAGFADPAGEHHDRIARSRRRRDFQRRGQPPHQRGLEHQ